jgi:hypothetical protein
LQQQICSDAFFRFIFASRTIKSLLLIHMNKRFITPMIIEAALLAIPMVASAQTSPASYGSKVGEGTYYLYNVEKNQFLNTSVNSPVLVDAEKTVAATLTASENGTYLISGLTCKYTKLGTYRDQHLWSDGNDTDTKWTFTSTTSSTEYQISAEQGNYSDAGFIGTWYLSGSNATSAVSEADTYVLIAENNFSAFSLSLQVDKLRAFLSELIQKGEKYGIDVTGASAVYDNADATLQQLQATIDALSEAITAAEEISVSPNEPIDVTNKWIPNADFEDGFGGWVSTTNARNNKIQNSSWNEAGIITGKFWENWSSGSFSGRMHYTVEGLPNGVYQLSMGAFRNTGNQTFVYANNDSVRVDDVTPKRYTLMFNVTDNTLDLGLASWGFSNGWMGLDNVNLMYYGATAESYKYWLRSWRAQHPELETSFSQKSLMETFLATLDDVENATEKSEIMAAVERWQELYTQLKANMEVYAAYRTAYNEAYNVLSLVAGASDAFYQLEEYLMEHDCDGQNGLLSTEEMQAVVDQINLLTDKVRRTGRSTGEDCTDLLVNSDFTDGVNGWTLVSGSVKTGGKAVNPNAETWQTNFVLTQQVAGVTNGIYQLDFNAFSRDGDYATSWAERENPVIHGFAVVGNCETPMADYSKGATQNAGIYLNPDVPEDGYYVPNNLDEVARGFEAGLYKNIAYGAVTDDTLRITLTARNMGTNCWVAWDNLRLTYQGKDGAVLKKAIDAFLQNLAGFDENTFSQKIKTELNQAVETARNAETADDRYSAYVALTSQKVLADASVQDYEELVTLIGKLSDDLTTYTATASANDVATAECLIEEVKSVLLSGGYDDTQDVKQRIEAAIAALTTPAAVSEASDEKPVDMTSRIVNPSFNDNNDNAWDGTAAGHGMPVQAAEFWNCNFDMHQTITNLPNGVYEINVDGFYRNGWATPENWQSYQDGTSEVNSFIYGITADGRKSVAFKSYWDEAIDEALGINETHTTLNEQSVHAPNDMASAVSYFEIGKYTNNSLIVRVTDGTLTLGISKETLVAADWTMFDNFRLTYYGQNSQKDTNGTTDAVNVIESSTRTASNIWFDLSGRRIQEPKQAGVYIHDGKKVIFR